MKGILGESKINESTKETDVNKLDKIDEMYADF